MAEAMEYSLEELNFFRVCYITTRILPDSLRTVFKQEWDNRYQATHGRWQETAKNGIDFYNMESPRSRTRNARQLAVIRNGNTSEWDCTCLFYAILYSDSVVNGLNPAVRSAIDDLRLFRNEVFAHVSDGTLSESNFNSHIDKVITAFTSLKLDTTNIERIKTQKSFPTEELRVITEQLQEEKMRNEEPQPFCVLPTKPSHQVIHRPDKIREIQAKMERLRSTKPNEITVVYLSGNPGCGKSEIARQVGEKNYDKASGSLTDIKFVFTLNASSNETLIESYMEFAISLKCDEHSATSILTSKDLSHEDRLIQLKCLAAPKLRRYSLWLIIVDNVTDVKSVFRYLPQAGEKTEGNGQILVTTQDTRSIPPDESYACHLSLSRGMKDDEAIRTLSEISGTVADEETTLEIAQALDFQPLALACAATYMKRVRNTNPMFSWEGYREKLKQGQRPATEGEFQRISTAYSQPMTAAVRLAVEKEMAQEEVMKHAFHFLSVMAPQPIPLEYVVQYVTRLLPDKDKELVAADIVTSSLILSSENNLKEIAVHQVVHSCLQTVVHMQNEIEKFHFLMNVIQAFSTLLTSFRNHDVYNIVATKFTIVHFTEVSKKLKILNPNFIQDNKMHIKDLDQSIECLTSMGNISKIHGKYEAQYIFHKITFMIVKNMEKYKNHPTLASILNNLGNAYLKLRQCKKAQQCFERALAIQEKAYDQDDPTLAKTWNNLGNNNLKLRQYEEAQQCYARALAIQEKAYDQDTPPLAKTLNNLGNNYFKLRQYKEAQQCYERALAIEEKAYNQDHPLLADTLNNVGNNYLKLRQYKEAQQYYERALAIKEKAYDQDHPTLADTLNNLGNNYQELRQYKEAQQCYERALAIKEKAYDQDHPTLSETLNNLGNNYQDMRQYKEAQQCYERALAIEEKGYDQDHQTLAITLNNLGNNYQELCQYEEAQQCYERALAIKEKVYNQDHPTLAKTLNNLGNNYQELRQYEEAQQCYERAFAIEEKAYDQDHPTLAKTLNNLGNNYQELRQYKEAQQCYERALAIKEKAYDQDHPTLAKTLNNLGNNYQELRQYEEAQQCYERALAIEEKAYDQDHPTLAITLNNLGNNYFKLRKYKEAQQRYERALAIQEKTYDQDHPTLAITLNNLGNNYFKLRQYKEAQQRYERALAIQEKTYDQDHPTLAITLNNLGNNYQELRQYEEARHCYERALAIKEKAYDQDHPTLPDTLNNLGNNYQELRPYKEAQQCYERALAIELLSVT